VRRVRNIIAVCCDKRHGIMLGKYFQLDRHSLRSGDERCLNIVGRATQRVGRWGMDMLEYRSPWLGPCGSYALILCANAFHFVLLGCVFCNLTYVYP